MKKHVIIYVVFISFIYDIMCSESDSICTRIERKVGHKKAPFIYRVLVPYMTKCNSLTTRMCEKERFETRQRWKVFTVENTIIIQECCAGYTQRSAETTESSSIKCDPICVPTCTNGYCSKPSTCTCNPGYQADPDEYHICHPICSQKCEHGTCEAPDTCKCHFGYNLVNQTCTPICSEPCANGSCIAPGTCECNYGYRKAPDNTCKPYCSVGCTNGQCVSPEHCECDPGFSKETDSICKPVCDDPCGNGTCIAPDKCECYPGYKVNTEFDSRNQSEICIPECTECGGFCEEPDKCVCDAIFEEKHLGADGEPCNCFRNCTEGEIVCVKTVCSPSSAYLEDDISNDTFTESSRDYSLHDEDYEYEDYNDYDEVEKVTPNKKSNVVHKHGVEEKSSKKDSQKDLHDKRVISIIIYIVALVMVLVVLISVAVLIIFKKKVLSFFIGAQYPIEELESNHLSRVGQEQPANNENNVQ